MSGPALSARAAAARLLVRVLDEGLTAEQALSAEGDTPDSALVRELFLGTLRFYFSLSAEVDACLSRPLKKPNTVVRYLLLVGAYQLRHTRIPDHAAVHESAEAARRLAGKWAVGMTNAILRRLARSGAASANTPEAAYDHPAWLIEALRIQYPQRWQAVLATSLERAPMSLRVNTLLTSPEAYRDRLAEAGLAYHTHDRPETLTLTAPTGVDTLPGFDAGEISVQDSGAQRIAPLLLDQLPHVGLRCLDACAAPGGKTFHLHEAALAAGREIAITTTEVSSRRAEHLLRERDRLHHPGIRALIGDATRLDWFDGQPFDAILLDAPCSGTGTLRRHPDIKVLKTGADIPGFAALQRRLLDNLWHTLRPGGTLLYCTCSVLEQENDAVIQAFLDDTADARACPVQTQGAQQSQGGPSTEDALQMTYGIQWLPRSGGGDGYYASVLRRAAAP